MTSPLPPIPERATVDAEHLRLLSIFHFVAAGLGAAGLAFLAVHFLMFRTMFARPDLWTAQGGQPPPAAVMDIFRWFYVFFGAWILGGLVMNLLAGLFLRARKHPIFTLITAGLNCLHIPIGTVLGVFTIVVLSRPSVRHLYDSASR